MTLNEAQVNKSYKISEVFGKSNERRRLLDMGFSKDSIVSVYQRAPFKGAVLVSLRGTMIALRTKVAELIEITELSDSIGRLI